MSELPLRAPSDYLQSLRKGLDARRSELKQVALARITAIADPAAAPDPSYVAGLHAAMTAALEYGLGALAAPEREPPPVPVDLLAQARLAARNGVSLDAVLRRYAAGHSLLTEALLEEAAAAGVGATELRDILRALALRYDRIVAEVGEDYAREAAAEPRDPEQRRYTLLRRLLAGEPLDPGALRYEIENHHLAIVAFGEQAAPALTGLSMHLDRHLLLSEPDLHAAWAWLGGRLEFDQRDLNFVSSYPWPDGCTFACGEPGHGLAGWRLSHRQAAAAMLVAQRGTATVVHYADVALLAAALHDDLLATSLRRRYLAPLEADRVGGPVAKQTLRAVFAAGGNLSSAAATLGIHRRTVASRLAAIEDLLNRPIDAASAELQTALCLDALDEPAASPQP